MQDDTILEIPMADDTASEQRAAKARHLKPYCFRPGQSGNPAGRPLGARNRLAETYHEDLYAEWLKRGRAAIEDLDSETLVKVVMSSVPREAKLNVGIGLGDQLAAMLERMQDDEPAVIDGHASQIN